MQWYSACKFAQSVTALHTAHVHLKWDSLVSTGLALGQNGQEMEFTAQKGQIFLVLCRQTEIDPFPRIEWVVKVWNVKLTVPKCQG